MFEQTKKFCDSLLKNGLPGFDLIAYHKGECVLRYMGGYSDLENKIAINGKEKYNIYSCSKPITCTAAMQLWEKGMFSLEDKLSDYMPEFKDMTVQTESGIKKAENPILIKHLFEMTAGFSYDCESPWLKKAHSDTCGRCPTRETMKYLAKEPLLFEPGERWEYSLCHDVLAALVEVISGKSFEEYVKENIFDVAGMVDTVFVPDKEQIDSVVPQYRYENGKCVNIGKDVVPYRLGSQYASGGAGAVSTVEDYIKFTEALRLGKLVSKDTLKLMATDRMKDIDTREYWLGDTHGYGLGLRCCKGDMRYTDFGWDGAAGAYLAIDTEREISIYFASHLRTSPVQVARMFIYRLVRADLNGEEIQEVLKDLKDTCSYED